MVPSVRDAGLIENKDLSHRIGYAPWEPSCARNLHDLSHASSLSLTPFYSDPVFPSLPCRAIAKELACVASLPRKVLEQGQVFTLSDALGSGCHLIRAGPWQQ